MNSRRIWGMIIRHLYVWPRDFDNLADAFWWPSFDLFTWGLTTTFLEKQQGISSVIINLFLGAIILWMFVYRSQQEMGMAFLKEFWDRNLLNILTTPLTINEFLVSSVVMGFIKLLISAVWMVVLSYLLFAINIFHFGWYLIPFTMNLLVLGWSAGFLINGLIMRYGYRIQSFAWTLVLVLQPFSAVFYPVSSLPYWMQVVSWLLPTSYIFEGMRTVMSGGVLDSSMLFFAAGLNLLYFIFSLWFFKKSYESARKSGMIVKFS